MKNLTLKNMAQACNGTLVLPEGMSSEELEHKETTSVVIDSRKVTKDGMFVAVKGERQDGHSFIPAVAQAGVLGVICEREPEGCEIPYILVEDSLTAFRKIAAFYREQLSIPVVGITGSVGKTSTKEFIASVLSQKFKVCKTQKNFNNEIGLPMTVLSIQPEDEAAVLEMGISDFGEMTRLTEIAKPDYCVITNIGQCHLENLGSREGILKAKTEIFKSMNPDGCVFLNGEDDLLATVKKPWKNEIIRFGMSKKDAVYATDVVNKGLPGSEAVIHVADTQFPVRVPLPGVHMVLNALAATAVGWQLGLTTEQIAEGIAQVQAVAGRSHVIETPDYILIDDCYNANPVSMKAAIDLLGTALQRKVAVLGDMFELGKDEAVLHAQIGEYAMTHGVDVLICIGELSKNMYERAVETLSGKEHGSREIYYFPTREEAMIQLPHILHTGDAVLIKASHSMKFEEIVEQSTGRI